jgi:hypothetical protein
MRILILALAFITTSVAVAQNSSNTNEAFVTIPRNYTFQNKVEITNMPAVRSQDSIGICGAFAVAAVLDYNNCRKNNWDCKTIGDDKRVSTLDLARMASSPNDKEMAKDKDFSVRVLLGFIPSYPAKVVLDYQKTVSKESCAPFASIVNRYADENPLQNETFGRLEQQVRSYTEGQSSCIECIEELIKKDFPRINNLADVRTALAVAKEFAPEEVKYLYGSGSAPAGALGKVGFELFLKQLLISDKCDKANQLIQIQGQLSIFEPTQASKRVDEFKQYISTRLNQKEPVILSSICADRRSDPLQCNGGRHGLVIVGSATVCNVGTPPRCIQAYKLHNSWGQSWQDAHNDGWVSADQLISRIDWNALEPAMAITTTGQ